MILRHPCTQVTPASVSLSHPPWSRTRDNNGVSGLGAAPCVDGTGFDTWPSRVSTPLWPIRQRNCVSRAARSEDTHRQAGGSGCMRPVDDHSDECGG